MPSNIRGNTFFNPELNWEDTSDERFKNIKVIGEHIKGLKCPDCGAQAIKTDKPGVAMCGDCPGWYFLYKDDKVNGKIKTKIIIENGEYVTVPVYKTKTITNHP